MRLGTAIERLFDNYIYASDKEWIRDKVAWALYQTWKASDESKTELQTNCKMPYKDCEDCETHLKARGYCNECKWYGDKQVCGRCRCGNLFCEAEPQPRCPKCGARGYIRSLESMGVKLKHFDEYKWKCTNCNKYFKEEPKDEPQTERSACDTCQWYNSGIPCGVEPSVCKRAVEYEPQTERSE